MAYGVDFSRFREPKRASVDLDLGPLVETHMTRCISCTRCVRFTTEVAGITQMGQTGRGEDSEITSYLNETLNSNLQGNIIDLCPVGALVSKPYAFTARPWELTKTETIDVMDALGSNIRVDTKGREVMRILPRNNDGVNEEWLSDKSRFVWDGLRRQRLDQPYIRRNGKLSPASWGEAFAEIKSKASGKKTAFLAGDLVSTETMFAAKALADHFGDTVECRVDGAALPKDDRYGYVGDAKIEDIDDAKMILLIGANPRQEAPVLNARIRKAWLDGAKVARIGADDDLTYDVMQIGTGREALAELAAMDHSDKHGVPGVMIIGQGALLGSDGEKVLATALAAAQAAQSKVMILHTAAGRVGGLDVGFATDGGRDAATENADIIYNIGVDEVDIPAGPFVIYQGSHGDRGAHRADVILPAAAYTEEGGIFVNTEGRPQMALRAGFPPGQAKENWAILRALSAELGATLGFDSLMALRKAMFAAHPHLAEIDQVPHNEPVARKAAKLRKGDFETAVSDHYLTNPIARASQVMAELSQNAQASPAIAAE